MQRTTSIRRTTSLQRTTSSQSHSSQSTSSVSENITVTTLKRAGSTMVLQRTKSLQKQLSLVNSLPTSATVQKVPSVRKVNSLPKSGSLQKRKSSVPPRPLAIKRQRLKREPFTFEEVKPTKKRQRDSPAKDRLFDKGDYVAVRAEKGKFYLCQTAQDVYDTKKTFKIRWLTQVQEDPVRLYKVDYYDTTEPDCVISKVRVGRAGKGLLQLDAEAVDSINQLLTAAETGQDVTSLDDSLFEEPTVKRKKKATPKPKAKEKKATVRKSKKPPLKKSTSKVGQLKKSGSTKKKKVPTATLR